MSDHRAKKRRLNRDSHEQSYDDGADGGYKNNSNYTDTSKPSARFKPTTPREWTISIAIPTSIITSCVTREQRTTNVGRIARALAVFSIDEVVVFDDTPAESRTVHVDENSYTGETDPAHFMAHILSYLETPPFMRKILFPLHPNLRSQGLLPSLDMPHHPHKDEWLPYCEGLTSQGKPSNGRKGTLIDIGVGGGVTIPDEILPRTRVTIHFPEGPTSTPVAVHPTAPRIDGGYFWGYSVRRCGSLSNVFTESPYEGGYDVSIGTSERGETLPLMLPYSKRILFKHLLITFGGPRGLEYAAMNDADLSRMNVGGGKTKELFDYWVNVLPNQGSRTIRTEEAVLIALTGLRRLWEMR